QKDSCFLSTEKTLSFVINPLLVIDAIKTLQGDSNSRDQKCRNLEKSVQRPECQWRGWNLQFSHAHNSQL
uniref:Uncharacterized protein n=1 Tax=Geospiza parvula TaxID=87175 RepID=A0A8U8BA49_GEOPR